MANIIGIGKNNNLIGTTGDDRIDGYGEDDFINGGAGNDTIVYYDSDNSANIDGGKGVNALDAAKSSSALNVVLSKYKNIQNYFGSNFNDTITGTTEANLIRTGSGNNYIDGMGGNDNIIGGAGNDTIVYYANSKAASIDGGAGNNVLDVSKASIAVNIDLSLYKNIQNVIGGSKGGKFAGTNGSNTIIAGAGDTYINGKGGGDSLVGGAGNDTIVYYASDNLKNIDGGAGINTLDASKVKPGAAIDLSLYNHMQNVIGSAYDDTISGTTAANAITSGEGKNYLDGRGGGDTIVGGAGNDTIIYYANDDAAFINGGGGQNTLDAAAAKAAVSIDFSKYKNIQNYNATALGDTIAGSTTVNIINGGAGQDYIDGKGGADIISAGAGNDNMVFYAGSFYDGGSGVNTLTAAAAKAGANVDLNKAQYKNIQEVIGSSYADNLVGGAGNDTLKGGAGNDILKAGKAGSFLDGGAGNDTFTGGSGKDTYFFQTGFGKDTITKAAGNSSDTILFGAGITKNNLLITRNGTDLVLKADDDISSLTLKDWYNSTDKITNFQFSDGSTDSITNFNWTKDLVFKSGTFDIVLDYTYDTNHFFNDMSARKVLEAAASAWAKVINEDFPAFAANQGLFVKNPSTGQPMELNTNNLTAGADLTIFVGAHKLASGVLGQGGPTGYYAGDQRYEGAKFEPVAGSIQFDSDTPWFFDSTPDTANDIPADKMDFLSVAEHEMGHILGLGTAPQWGKLILNNTFIGSNAETAYGGPVPLSKTGAGTISDHWGKDILIGGSQPLMNPYSSNGQRNSITALDKAGLADLGYNVK